MRRAIIAFLCAGFATAAGAEGMALTYYKQCTGPAMERQAQAIYAGAPCQQTDTCQQFEQFLYENNVELSCFGDAVDICFVFDDYDTCFREVIEYVELRTDTLVRAFPSERVQAAARLADGLLSRGLLRALERRQQQADFDCRAPDEISVLEEFGFTLDTYCHGLGAMLLLENERNISYRTEKLETEHQ